MTTISDTKQGLGSPLVNVIRCSAPAHTEDAQCGSPVFYDWGLQVLNSYTGTNPTGPNVKFANYADGQNVKICARCNTPFIVVEGDLVDISADLGAEDVKAIISRGQATLPHPKQKDP